MIHEQLKKIDDILSAIVDDKFAAGASCLILDNGKEAYYGEKGFIDIKNNKPVKRDSIFRLYSMSKPLTAAAAMLLVEDGLLDMNQPVGDYIPSFKNQTVADGYNRLSVNRPMKVKDLLNMTSGLSYCGILNTTEHMASELTDEAIKRIGTDNEMSTYEFANRLGEFPLIFSPGERFNYSYSADVLGAVIEVVSKMKFSEFLQKRLFEPLGMKDTGFYVPADKQDRLTKVYENTPEGLKEYNYNHLIINLKMDHAPAFESGGAGLVSTLDDYSHFAMMLLNNGVYEGKRVMMPGTVKYFTEGGTEDGPKECLKGWDGMNGFEYANLMRVMKDPSKAVTISSMGEYGWDGWLGPYFINDPTHKVTILFMLQLTNAGTTTYTRRIRNVVYSSVE